MQGPGPKRTWATNIFSHIALRNCLRRPSRSRSSHGFGAASKRMLFLCCRMAEAEYRLRARALFFSQFVSRPMNPPLLPVVPIEFITQVFRLVRPRRSGGTPNQSHGKLRNPRRRPARPCRRELNAALSLTPRHLENYIIHNITYYTGSLLPRNTKHTAPLVKGIHG